MSQSVDARASTVAVRNISLYEKHVLNAYLIFVSCRKMVASQMQSIRDHTESVGCQLDKRHRVVLTDL